MIGRRQVGLGINLRQISNTELDGIGNTRDRFAACNVYLKTTPMDCDFLRNRVSIIIMPRTLHLF
jgi:hypothetical protein